MTISETKKEKDEDSEIEDEEIATIPEEIDKFLK